MTQKIGILHPGNMGVAVANTVHRSGYEVYWAGNGRSSATHERAQGAGLINVGSVEALCRETAVMLSVCPPHAAEAVADEVIGHQFKGLFIDGNAISPQKANRIGDKMAQVNIQFVDGGIVGGPPTKPMTTWLHLSGGAADKASQYFSAGPLETSIVGAEIGQASALKMCFAAQTKGGLALLALVLGAADKMGVRSALEEQWANYDPNKPTDAQRRVVSVAHNKAWRFAGEMDEMVETFGAIGLPAGFHEGAANIYRRIGHFYNQETAPTIEDVLAAIQT
ncbi:MAG: DUF1932 domain-containing protein [Chloroflexota bacterium]